METGTELMDRTKDMSREERQAEWQKRYAEKQRLALEAVAKRDAKFKENPTDCDGNTLKVGDRVVCCNSYGGVKRLEIYTLQSISKKGFNVSTDKQLQWAKDNPGYNNGKPHTLFRKPGMVCLYIKPHKGGLNEN